MKTNFSSDEELNQALHETADDALARNKELVARNLVLPVYSMEGISKKA